MTTGDEHDEAALDSPEAVVAGPSAEAQVGELQERILRVQAELENFRKRSRREYDDAQRYREIDVLRDLLPVLDNVLRAIEAAEKSADVESLKAGFRMTAQQIEKLLANHGCTTIETDGQPFDPAVLSSFGWGYFWAIATAAYLLLRQDVDGTELDEVVIDEPGE